MDLFGGTRLFSFFNYAGFRQRLSSNPRLTFPSQQMRQERLLISVFRLQLVRRLSGHEGDAILTPTQVNRFCVTKFPPV